MAADSLRPSWRGLAVAGALGCAVASLAGATAVTRGAGPAGAATEASWRVLQLNLCDSGVAACFTGRSVTEAATVIGQWRPDVVTLNEVCRRDVAVLSRAVSQAHPGRRIASAFEAALDRPTDSAYRCLNGQRYGVGILTVLPSTASGYRRYGGRFPVQDRADPEERVWLCIRAPGDVYACTTHAASTSTAVALSQCRYLLRRALPAVLRTAGEEPVVVGADLNLVSGRRPGPQPCLTGGFHRVDDGARQDVVMGPGLTARRETVIDMHGATDHPGLLVDVAGRDSASH